MTYFDQAKSYVLSDSSVTDKSCQLSQHIAKLQAMSKWTFLVGVALLLGPASRGALAQGITATIVGTVKDPQGALVPGATVKATNAATGLAQSTTTDGQAEYRLGNLAVGRYDVEVEASGFEKYLQSNIVLSVDQTQTIDVSLKVGTQMQTVTVSTAPLS